MTEFAELMSDEEARALGIRARYYNIERYRIGREPSRLWAIEETDRRHWEKPHIITVSPKEKNDDR